MDSMWDGYDVIGDVHGHADKLEGLLVQMGFVCAHGVWRHPTRQAIFVGDLIDRGPEQRRTVELARAMVDAGSAQMVIGNHEFNAIAWATEDPDTPGEYLRRHSEKNTDQHEQFLRQVGEGSSLHDEYLEWFRSLPLWIDLGDLRVVHACWDDASMTVLRPLLGHNCSLTDAVVRDGCHKGTATYDAVETVLKGPEIDLPHRCGYADKSGICRHRARMRWWDPGADTLRRAAEIPPDCAACDGAPMEPLPDTPLGDRMRAAYTDDVPVVFGHYWRTIDSPVTYQKTICVDYSVGAGGPLVAYRWSDNDENPVPKSSNAKRMPSERKRCSVCAVASLFCISRDSVISRTSRDGHRLFKQRMTVASKFCPRNWAGETFTETETFSGQALASVQALLNTHSPIWPINPLSSATGMKSAADISPRVACDQRMSASHETVERSAILMIGW